jgi:glyoxylase-like metal-dependent hydrolase (beta-lactamase superfamily II)
MLKRLCLTFIGLVLGQGACAGEVLTVFPGVRLIAGQASLAAQPDGNTILIDAPQGLIVFDTGRHPEHTQQILEAAAASRQPVRAIINSHWHLDHIGGNALLREKYPEVRIYASSALEQALGGFLADYRKQLAGALDHAGSDERKQAPLRQEIALIDAGKRLLPTDVISESGLRSIAGRMLDVQLERDAVTAHDVWVFDVRSRVLLAGDLVTLPAPFLDTACPTRWQTALNHVSVKRFRLLVPGHGAPMERHAFEIYRKAFARFISCGSGTSPKGDCIDGWMNDGAELIPEKDRAYARALLGYYVDNVLRGDQQRLSKLCAA